MKNIKFPAVPKDLLDELDKRFPDKIPDTPITMDEFRKLQGEQSVIKFLKYQFNLQNKNILEN